MTRGTLREELRGIRRRALLVAAVAGLLSLVGLLIDRQQFLRSYLLGYLLWIALPLGSLALVMLHHLTGGSWGFAVRRVLEAAVRTLPLFPVLFVPVALGLRTLYPWARPEVLEHDPLLQEKALYLDPSFFFVRAALYFAVWLGIAALLGRLVRRQDRTGDPRLVHRLRVVSGPGLGLYALTMTFASVDWAMSLEPHWFSTLYGLIFIVGQGISVLCLSIVVAGWLAGHEPFSRWFEARHFHDLGNLLLAFVMLWGYVSFSQYLIIWSGNLAEEAPWYVARGGHGWQVVATLLILLHFFVPFFVLLSRRAKRAPRVLMRVALALAALRFVDLVWLIVPAFHPDRLALSWMDVTVPLALGGLWVALYAHQLEGRPLVSLQDAHLETALERAPGEPS